MMGVAPVPGAAGTWLCPEPADRERLLDMEQRLRPVRMAAYLTLAGTLAVCGPWMGWWPLLPLVISAACFRALEKRMPSSPRPELFTAAGWLVNQLAIATSIAVSGGPRSPAVAWLVIPAVVLPARYRTRGIALGVAITVGLMLAATVGVDPAWAAAHPHRILFPVALAITVVVLSTALMRSDLQHRSDAVLDPLTGMLNRAALSTRAAELTQQAAITRVPVGVIVADIDHFKAVNDEHGHAAGDAVLKEVAYALRKALRAYDLAYRVGGEEFVVLVPGAGVAATAGLAEHLRTSVAERPVAGVHITLSVGVSASGSDGFDFDGVFEEADTALYEAKQAGRNRVCVYDRERTRDATSLAAA
jgi:diguanylate cyclase (GGDEF)-like protein